MGFIQLAKKSKDLSPEYAITYEEPKVNKGEVYTKENEGFRDTTYTDTVGKKTIGHGFNLSEPSVAKYIPPEVFAGKRKLSLAESDKIFSTLYNQSKTGASNFVSPQVFNTLPEDAQNVLTDLHYNMGSSRLAQFKKMQVAIKSGDYNKAADELLNSKYAKQVKGRAIKNANLLRNLAKVKKANVSLPKERLPGLYPKRADLVSRQFTPKEQQRIEKYQKEKLVRSGITPYTENMSPGIRGIMRAAELAGTGKMFGAMWGLYSGVKPAVVAGMRGEEVTPETLLEDRSFQEVKGFKRLAQEATTGALTGTLGPLGKFISVPSDIQQMLLETVIDISAVGISGAIKRSLEPNQLFNKAWQRIESSPGFSSQVDSQMVEKGIPLYLKQEYIKDIKRKSYDWFMKKKTYLEKLNLGLGKKGQVRIGKPKAPEGIQQEPIEGDKIREFITTVKEAKKTAPEVAEVIMSRYTPITNKETLIEAQLFVEKDPNEAYRIAMSPDATPRTFAIAEVLIDKAQQAGRWEEAKALVERLAEKATPLGQTIQALAMYERLTPEGILRYADSVLRKAKESISPEKLAKWEQLVKDLVNDADKQKLAKKLGIPYMSDELMKKLYDRALKIQGMGPGRDKQIEVALLLKDISREVPKEFWAKVSLIQTMSQLLNPKTIIRNILGNAGFWAIENLSEVVGTTVDAGLSFMTGKRTTYMPNLDTQFKGLKQGWNEGLQEAMLGIDLGKESITKFDLPQNSVFDSGVLAGLEKTLSVVLRAPDKAFYKAAFNDSLNQQMKAAKVTEPTFEMIEKAHYMGLYRTFQDDSALANVFSQIKRALNRLIPSMKGQFGLGDMILKYPRTPANILSRGIEYSPIGLINACISPVGNLLGHEYNQEEFVKDFSRGATGTVLLVGIGALLTSLGIMTARRVKDREAQELLEMVGLGDYKINISALKRFVLSGFSVDQAGLREGDILINYDWFQPNSIGMAIGANLVDKENKSLADSVLQAAQTLVDQPLLQGLSRITQGEGLIKSLGQTAVGIPASFMSTILNQLKQLTDNVSRNTQDPNFLKEAYNKVIYRVPGLSRTLPERINVWGKEKEVYQAGTNNPFNVFLNPAFVSKYNPEPEAKLVLDIWKQTGETIQFPRKAPKSLMINGQRHNLTEKEQRMFQEYIGTKTGVLYNILYNDPLFMKHSDDNKAKKLQGYLTDIYTAAKISVLGYEPRTVSKSVRKILLDLKDWYVKDAHQREKLQKRPKRRGFLALVSP